MWYITIHRTHQTVAVEPMVEGIYPLRVLQGKENALPWCSEAFLSTGVSAVPTNTARLCSFLLAEAVPLFSCSITLLSFLVPCLIFSISSPHLFSLHSLFLLFRFPRFPPVSSSFTFFFSVSSAADLLIQSHLLNPSPKSYPSFSRSIPCISGTGIYVRPLPCSPVLPAAGSRGC